jgi:anti-sigma-K factor RskA
MVASLARWNARLMPLIEDVREVVPPSWLWERLQSQLGWPQAARRTGLWNSLAFWRWTGLTSVVAVAVLAVVLTRTASVQNTGTPPAGTQYLVATLARQGGGAGWTATMDAQLAQIVIVPPAGFTVAANQSTEMWLIPAGEKPVSLGVIDAQHATVVHVAQAQLQALGPQATLAVSLEPHGGSPTGQPTGPVLAAGHPEKI